MNSKELLQKKLAVSAFDLDHTLLCDNSSYRFGLYLYTENLLSLRSLAFIMGWNIQHTVGFLPIDRLHTKAFGRLFQGQASSLVRQWAADFVHENFENLLYVPAIEKLKLAQESGHLTAIISSTPDFIVEPIAKKLNVPYWWGTQYAVDKDHKFCHIAKLILGNDKASILNELSLQFEIRKQEIYAYSDSHLDLPFLRAAGNAFGVNPNRQLRSICRKNNWSII